MAACREPGSDWLTLSRLLCAPTQQRGGTAGREGSLTVTFTLEKETEIASSLFIYFTTKGMDEPTTRPSPANTNTTRRNSRTQEETVHIKRQTRPMLKNRVNFRRILSHLVVQSLWSNISFSWLNPLANPDNQVDP